MGKPHLLVDFMQEYVLFAKCVFSNLFAWTLSSRPVCLCMQAFAIQSYVTGEGPYANWSKHVADPFGYNLLTIIGNEDRLPTL